MRLLEFVMDTRIIPVRARIQAVQAALVARGWHALLVPSADPHLSEYLPGRWQAREWLSGFTGSMGTLVVTVDRALLFADSRYWVQAEAELAGSGIELERVATGGSTAFYLAFLNEQRKDPDTHILPTLRCLLGGGAPKPPELYWQVQRELGVPIRHGYGMTECPMIANGAVGDTDEQLAHTEGGPVRGCEILVVDTDEVPVEPGVDGDIWVRGPMVAKGYTDAEATAAAFRDDGWFRTGDRGYLRADGHIVLTGRTKELIIRKGENISPREVEDVLQAHPAVGAVAVIGLADPERGERVCAVVEPTPGVAPLTFAAMQQHCRDAGLMTQKIPEQLEIVDALPRNPTLKVLKTELVQRFSA